MSKKIGPETDGSSPRVLICCLGDGRRVPRAVRFSRQLTQAGFEVNVASNGPAGDRALHFGIRARQRDRIGRHLERFGWFAPFVPDVIGLRDFLHDRRYGLSEFRALLRRHRFDILLIQDLALLPVAICHGQGAAVVFDAREYYPLQNEESRRFLRFDAPERRRLCGRWLPRADAVITVSDGLAARYASEFGVKPVVVFSASAAVAIDPHPVDGDRVRLVHHGVANQNRKLFYLFELMQRLSDRFSLDLYLVSADPQRIAAFRQAAEANPRIAVHDPVPFDALVRETARYDVGIHLLGTDNFNLRHAMPNKLFEFVQARLAVAVGPSPDMAKFVREHECGVIAEEPTVASLAEALERLTPADIERMKQASDAAAKTVTAEREGDKLIALLKTVLARKATGNRGARDDGI